MTKEIEFLLESPITISVGGQLQEESVLILRAPPLNSEKAKTAGIKLKAMALAAIGQVTKFWPDSEADEDDKEKAKEDNGEDMLNGFATVGVDIMPILETMKGLAPVVLKAGEGHAFTPKNWSMEMSAEDQIKLTGVFIKNFTLASTFSKKSP